jgi:O-antigen ligase
MNPGAKVGAPHEGERLRLVFAGLLGGFLGLSLLKFGNPPIFETLVSAPEDVYGFLLGFPWPIGWAYWLLALLGVVGLCNARLERRAPWWLVALPLSWLVWQIVAGTQSVDAQLTTPTLKHFGACVACFYLGYFSLVRVPRLWPFWLGLLCGFLLVLAQGWEQRFGGLEQTRAYFFIYLYPKMKTVSPEFLKKMSSDRIFSSLFYPNALAGVILLLLPVTLAVVWQARRRLTQSARTFLGLLIAIGAFGCLYWSGSKSGWLLMLCLGLMALLRLPWGKGLKVGLVAAVLLLGLTGFFWKYARFFQKGATSVSARFDYWSAAVQTVRANPLFGTGPGTFAIPYHKIKRPESEMARLVHNDYLEQASDSGVLGFALYTLFIGATLIRSFPRRGQRARDPAHPGISDSGDRLSISGAEAADQEWLIFSVWLGLLGWSLQGLVEFGLYIPALAWPAFALMGWLMARTPNGNAKLRPAD